MASLSVEADQLFGRIGGKELATAGWNCEQISQAIGSKEFATSLIATIFWQAFMSSSAFMQELGHARASSLIVYGGEQFIVRHGVEDEPRHDLIIFDPPFRQEYPFVNPRVGISDRELIDGWRRFVQSHHQTISSIFGGAILRHAPNAIVEAKEVNSFGLAVTAPPLVRFTSSNPSPNVPSFSAPSSALGVDETQNNGPLLCSVGVIGQDGNGREGVTAALHAIPAGASQVFIDGLLGTIDPNDQNAATDSCFIMVPGILAQVHSTVGLQGPLTGMTPRVNETVNFDGKGSGRVNTRVTGWSPDIPWVTQQPKNLQNQVVNQLKVLTDPHTRGGDSGTALIDSSDHILGFAFYTTTAGPGFSAWIWADSVFEALNLK